MAARVERVEAEGRRPRRRRGASCRCKRSTRASRSRERSESSLKPGRIGLRICPTPNPSPTAARKHGSTQPPFLDVPYRVRLLLF